MTNALISSWKHWLKVGMTEDSSSFDWTGRTAQKLSEKKNQNLEATLIAKADGVWAGGSGCLALQILSQEMGLPLLVETLVKDGELVKKSQKICTWTGTSEAIVGFERSFINLASYTSGIATQTHALVSRVKAKNMKRPIRITGTRKTLPGYRDLAIQSTLIGGAHPHRYNLSGGLLLKENHVVASGSIARAIEVARETSPHLLKIEIEVRNITELKEAIEAGAEVIMLDNFNVDKIKEAIAIKPTNTIYEVSGGITLQNIDSYLIEGLDVISVGSITHSVTALDLSLLMTALV